MKKILLLLLFCNYISLAQVITIGTTTLNKGAKGENGSMPELRTINGNSLIGTDNLVLSGTAAMDVFVPTLSDFNNPNVANANKIWRIENDITLDANVDFTGVKGIIFKDGGGVVDVNEKTILFDEASFQFDTDRLVFDFSSYSTVTETGTSVLGETDWILSNEINVRLPYTFTPTGVSIPAVAPYVVSGGGTPLTTRYWNVWDYPQAHNTLFLEEFRKYIINWEDQDNAPIAMPAGIGYSITYTPEGSQQSFIDLNSTFKDTPKISLRNFGGVSEDIDATFDNKNVLINLFEVINQTGGYLDVGQGVFQISMSEDKLFINPRHPDLVLTNGAGIKGLSAINSQLKVLHDPAVYAFRFLLIDSSPNTIIENTYFKGDTKLRQALNYEEEPQSAINTYDGSDYTIIRDCVLDGFSDGYGDFYEADLGGGAFTWEVGGLNASGVEEVSTVFMRSNLFALSQHKLDNGWTMITGGSYGWYDSAINYFSDVYFYDINGDLIDIAWRSPMFSRIVFPEGSVSLRCVLDYNGNAFPTDLRPRTPLISRFVTLERNKIINNYRNGGSNIGMGGKVINNYIAYNGGIPIGPGYGWDQEDGAQLLNGVVFEGNTFEGNVAGSITLPAQRDVQIINNIFRGKNFGFGIGESNINTSTAWDIKFEGNRIYNTWYQASRTSSNKNNHFYNCRIDLRNQNTVLEGNHLENTTIYAGDTGSRVRGVSYGGSFNKNNLLRITQPMTGRLMGGEQVIENLQVWFQNSYGFDNGLFWDEGSVVTYVDLVERKIDNLEIRFEDGVVNPAGTFFQPQNISNSKIPLPMKFWGGQRRDMKMTNNTLTGYLRWELTLTPYTTDGTDLKEVIVDGGTLTSSSDYTIPVFDTGANIGINLTIKNMLVDITNRANFNVSFNHAGFLKIKETTFKSDTSVNFDLTSSTVPHNVYLEDCDFDNVTFIGRTGTYNDKLVYTSVHEDMPVYADNAAAIADNYPVNYMYITATGDIKKTY